MKKLNTVLLALIGVGISSTALAQQTAKEPGEWYLGARVGALSLDSDRQGIKENVLYQADDGFSTFAGGLEGGFMLTEFWETRLYYDYVQAGIDGAPGDLYGYSYGVDYLYHLNDNFYAGLGINATDVGDLTDAMVRATFGHRSFITDQVSWRVEAGAQRGWELDHTELFANVGLQVWFGEPTASDVQERPVVQPKQAQQTTQETVDSDGDGVIDSKDKCVNTPAEYSVDENGCVKYKNETVREELLVEFAFDSSKVPESAMSRIEDIADFMKKHSQLDITIHGHTDSVGEEDYNQWLSERRAKAVADILVNRFDVSGQRVSYKGHGESDPKVMEDSAADRQENRRIEAELKVVNRVPVER
ncbi:OmpA family protein [Idiomarina seosinensis]|uniref:OmpA family protein n=1 Tax=Idiomarina seosinensis TaxID=281739 RepID=UPI00384E84B6